MKISILIEGSHEEAEQMIAAAKFFKQYGSLDGLVEPQKYMLEDGSFTEEQIGAMVFEEGQIIVRCDV